MTLRIACCVVVAVASASLPARAHHSFSMFDHERKISVSGTLKEFEYTNPHCWLHVNVVDAGTGRTLDWSFEMGSIGQIVAQGWKEDIVKPGDKITVEGYPMKDGSRGGQYLSARLADGRQFPQNPNPTPAR